MPKNIAITIPNSVDGDIHSDTEQNDEGDKVRGVNKVSVDLNEEAPICQTSKEQDCWDMYQKMIKKGINVNYDTILSTHHEEEKFLKGSLQDASYNILLQIMFRGVTFAMNVFVLRHLNQDVIGVMNVRLLLLESTVLFLSREAFRRACISQTTQHNWPQVINLVWLT
ncbi:hypothetical protein WDU94_001768 [Cyamophila willieti]